jgi:hypothetical protein
LIPSSCIAYAAVDVQLGVLEKPEIIYQVGKHRGQGSAEYPDALAGLLTRPPATKTANDRITVRQFLLWVLRSALIIERTTPRAVRYSTITLWHTFCTDLCTITP